MKGSGVRAASLDVWCFEVWCFDACRVTALDQAASPALIDSSNTIAIDEMAPRGRKRGAANVPPNSMLSSPQESPYSAAALRGRPTKPDASPKRSSITADKSLLLWVTQAPERTV